MANVVQAIIYAVQIFKRAMDVTQHSKKLPNDPNLGDDAEIEIAADSSEGSHVSHFRIYNLGKNVGNVYPRQRHLRIPHVYVKGVRIAKLTSPENEPVCQDDDDVNTTTN